MYIHPQAICWRRESPCSKSEKSAPASCDEVILLAAKDQDQRHSRSVPGLASHRLLRMRGIISPTHSTASRIEDV